MAARFFRNGGHRITRLNGWNGGKAPRGLYSNEEHLVLEAHIQATY